MITNLDLPGLSGYDLITALKSNGSNASVSVIAGEGKEFNVVEAFRLCAVDYLPRFAREAELVTAVENVIR